MPAPPPPFLQMRGCGGTTPGLVAGCPVMPTASPFPLVQTWGTFMGAPSSFISPYTRAHLFACVWHPRLPFVSAEHACTSLSLSPSSPSSPSFLDRRREMLAILSMAPSSPHTA
ncbi:hypothetical protein H696_01697 [Fonticula alba]|uniref:Uncharacterized protein n=1 Tax=Fonticula alba TaxID=691883 RepID=A0A058ZD13_FONAL|nr:hypothetical protein H696_01697 [Fonticula alba]KCV72300.1 hypothetical protein H696_01697 [Fonticula alba]|eukprot:XP_009493878.1 hypothetical protein H696_01697 [Fonticula alba]